MNPPGWLLHHRSKRGVITEAAVGEETVLTASVSLEAVLRAKVYNGYQRISLFNHTIEVPNVELYEEVEIHLVPDTAKRVMEIRIRWNEKMVHSVALPLEEFRVHL